MTLTEGHLVFDFTGSISAKRLDQEGCPETMKNVDFVVEEPNRTLLIEVKDPSDPHTTETARQNFVQDIKSKRFVNETLVPKCRDSYTYLHLMGNNRKPFVYVVLLSLYENKDKPDVLTGLQERLKQRLRKEGKKRWVRQYVQDAVVLNISMWNRQFAYHAERRVP
ncbi:MAG: hypothetical protein AB1473_06520 [Thermodesulfobacteriota bacterium]